MDVHRAHSTVKNQKIRFETLGAKPHCDGSMDQIFELASTG